MGRHRVIDLRRLLDPKGVPLREHVAEVAWLGSVIEVVTACHVGSRWERGSVRCEDLKCAGRVAVRRTGDACEWFCANCASSGAVVGFRGGSWDLTDLERADETDRSDALVFARLDELDAVRHVRLAPELRLALALSAAHADYVIVPFAERELAELLAVLDDGETRIAPADRRLVERFSARVDAALLMCEARKVEPPTVH